MQRFWLEFDDVTGMANDCLGMAPREALRVLRSCLKQSYAGIYKVEKDKAQMSGEFTADPAAVLKRVHERTLEFEETTLEQQQRADREWDALARGKRTGLQFKPLFEHAIAELEKAGIGASDRGLFLSSCGEGMWAVILKDRREYVGAAGQLEVRAPHTWLEAHVVLLEEEARAQGARALVAAFHGGGSGGDSAAQLAAAQARSDDQAQGLGKRKQQKVAKAAAVAAVSSGFPPEVAAAEAERDRGVCFRLRDTGHCDRLSCTFSHDPKEITEAKKQKQASQARKTGKASDGGEGGGKHCGKDDGGKSDGDKGKGTGRGKAKPKELCRAFAAGTCSRGDKCHFSHNDASVRSLVTALSSNPSVALSISVSASASTAAGQPAAGVSETPPSVAALPPGLPRGSFGLNRARPNTPRSSLPAM